MNKLLFNPFIKVAGSRALVYGLIIILLSSLIAYFSHTCFDGIIDVHFSSYRLLSVKIFEGLLNWASLSIVFYFISLLITGSSVRFIDVTGTMALSRFPMLISALIGFVMMKNKAAEYLSWKLLNIGDEITLHIGDIIVFLISLILVLICIIWTVALMYNAFKVSANAKGQKSIIAFIIGLIISEILVKTVLYWTGYLTLIYNI